MKTLNLNKLILIAVLFIVSIIFSSAVDASCRYNSGLLDVQSGSQQYQVYDDAIAGGRYVDACNDTPDEYEITFYKLGLCTATTAANDLSSCQYVVNNADGVTHVIKKGTSGAMAIPEFSIDPGTYPFMVVVISNKLGIKHSFTATNSLTGVSSSAGASCWTSVAGPSAYTNESHSSVHGTTVSDETQLIKCGAASASAPVFSYEVINILTKDNCLNPENNANWFPGTGDYSSFGIVGNGTAEVSLLNSSDDWATACTNSAKILWTTTLTTPYVVTADSTFQLNMKTTDSVSVDFDSDSGNNNIMKMGADPVQLYLTVTE